jgi:hypothetical protein
VSCPTGKRVKKGKNMKKMLLITIAAVLLAVGSSAVLAGTIGTKTQGPKRWQTYPVWVNYTGKAATQRHSTDVYDVRGWSKVKVQVTGETRLGNYSGLQGSAGIEGAPTATGPWTDELAYSEYTSLAPGAITSDRSVTITPKNNFWRTWWTRTRNCINVYLTGSED